MFAGYGITAADHHYDDYAGLDVKDKIVLILRHEPQEADEKSVFDGKELTSHADLRRSKPPTRRCTARAAVILVNDMAAHPTRHRYPTSWWSSARDTGPTDAGILFVQVKEADAEAWLKAEGRDLRRSKPASTRI